METLKRKINFEVYLIALLITFVFFVLGIIVGDYIAYKKMDSLSISQKAIFAFFSASEFKNLENKTNYCNLSWSDIWEEKVGIGEVLSALELRFGKTNEKVIEQKRIYNEVQFKTLGVVEKVNKVCKYEWDIILFFYTNDKNDLRGDYKLSEFQGYALDTLYEMDREKIKIFAFDINAFGESSKNLITEYNLSYYPSLVINGKIYKGFRSRYEIQKIIGK